MPMSGCPGCPAGRLRSKGKRADEEASRGPAMPMAAGGRRSAAEATELCARVVRLDPASPAAGGAKWRACEVAAIGVARRAGSCNDDEEGAAGACGGIDKEKGVRESYREYGEGSERARLLESLSHGVGRRAVGGAAQLASVSWRRSIGNSRGGRALAATNGVRTPAGGQLGANLEEDPSTCPGPASPLQPAPESTSPGEGSIRASCLLEAKGTPRLATNGSRSTPQPMQEDASELRHVWRPTIRVCKLADYGPMQSQLIGPDTRGLHGGPSRRPLFASRRTRALPTHPTLSARGGPLESRKRGREGRDR